MTKQEVLNKVWQWFIVEKHPSAYQKIEGKVGQCVYKGSVDPMQRCGIGCLLPDNFPPDGELGGLPKGNSISGILETAAVIVRNGDTAAPVGPVGFLRVYAILSDFTDLSGRRFLDAIQSAHDSAATSSTDAFADLLRANLSDVARRFGLSIPGEVPTQEI